MPGTLLPHPRIQFFDGNGAPLAGGKLYIFEAGTVSPYTVYQDIDLSTPWDHPIVLNAAGRPSANIYLDADTVRVRLDDANDVTIWTADNVPATGVSGSGLGQAAFCFGGDASYEYNNTSYPAGADFNALVRGAATWFIESSQLGGTYVLEADVWSPLGGVATVGIVNLTDAPNTALTNGEAIGTGSTTGERIRSSSDGISFAAAGTEKLYGIKAHTDDATKPVIVTGVRLIQTG